mgnify:CR=1 FL=1
MTFNSQICTTREQSERLLALGLKKETADCHYEGRKNKECEWEVAVMGGCYYSWDFPAWSLHRLIEMMPKCVRAHSSGDDSSRLHSYVPKFDYQGVTIENIDEILAEFYQHTDLFGNIIDCIEWLIKEGYFNKEYLEE